VGATLSLRDGTFRYGKRDIFSQLNLDLAAGELLCILGPNGCGKTTLLRCLNGALPLSGGRVCLDDRDVAAMPVDERARWMGFVFQEHAAPFPFPVLEVVRMGRTPHLGFLAAPSHKDTELAEEALAVVGLLRLRDQPYTQISGGERQLVLIARTLAQRPAVILLDEPTSHLDFRNQALVLRTIRTLAEQGLAVAMTSHLPDHALLYATTVAMMSEGHFLAVGPPDEVMTEERLRQTYGMDVRLLTVEDPASGKTRRFCVPA